MVDVVLDTAVCCWCAQVNTAQFVVTLDRQSPQEFSPFIGKVLVQLLSLFCSCFGENTTFPACVLPMPAWLV